jgi:hypothetical protein
VSELRRYGEASAELEDEPELHHEWAGSEDRAIRRALMRSPALPPEAAERIVETRRSGMHTMGSNPTVPIELLADNPGARRRRERVTEAAPGGPDEVSTHPNRLRYVQVGSPTLDLVLARSDSLTLQTAVALAGREDPPADPWVLAILIARFGEPVEATVHSTASAGRRAAVDHLTRRAAR